MITRIYRVYDNTKREFVNEHYYYNQYKNFDYDKEYIYYHTRYKNNILTNATRLISTKNNLTKFYGIELCRRLDNDE